MISYLRSIGLSNPSQNAFLFDNQLPYRQSLAKVFCKIGRVVVAMLMIGSNTIFAQLINMSGVVSSATDDAAIYTVSKGRFTNRISIGENCNANIVCNDERSLPEHICARRSDGSGSVLVMSNRDAITSVAGQQTFPAMGEEIFGGVIIAWTDEWHDTFDQVIYTQCIEASCRFGISTVPASSASFEVITKIQEPLHWNEVSMACQYPVPDDMCCSQAFTFHSSHFLEPLFYHATGTGICRSAPHQRSTYFLAFFHGRNVDIDFDIIKY